MKNFLKRSPAVDSLVRFGHMLMDRVKRRKSDHPIFTQLDKTKEMEHFPLELHKKPVEFCKEEQVSNNINGIKVKEVDVPQGRIVSANLLDRGAGRRSIKERWYVCKYFL